MRPLSRFYSSLFAAFASAVLGLVAPSAQASTLLLSDYGTGKVYQYDDSGNATLIAAFEGGGPVGLLKESSGSVLVADYNAQSIHRIETNGSVTNLASLSFRPVGLAAGPGGTIYVTDYYGGNILTLDAAGNATPFATGVESAWTPVWDGTGTLYVGQTADSGAAGDVVKIDSEGNVTLFADLNGTTSVGFTSTGNLLAVVYLESKIYSIDPLGNVSVFADAADGLAFPVGMVIDPVTDDVFVTNVQTQSILRFTAAGVVSTFALNQEFMAPYGLALSDITFPEYGTEVPEPSTTALAVVALASFGAARRRAASGR